MKVDCECGPGLDHQVPELALVGMDVVSLFPSLSSKKTSEIVHRKVAETDMEIEGFDWKKAMLYVKLNKDKASNTKKEIKKFLPMRTSARGAEPGMGCKSFRQEKIMKKQWFFVKTNPTKEQKKEMAGMVAEIGIRILWENYAFDFGGKTYLQKEGGPIGQRPTMAASRLVMNDFFWNYEKILETGKIEITLLKVYVDDERQASTVMKKGMRYDENSKKFSWSEEAEMEDIQKEKGGEDKNMFRARICQPAMNSVNKEGPCVHH